MTDAGRRREPIRLGVIGTGLAVEKLHWPALKRMPDRFRVAAFCDLERPTAEHFAGYSGAAMDDYTADYHDLLRREDVDAVLISLPIPLNYAVTRAALEAGKEVICEKPSGANEAEGRAFVELAAAHPERTVLIAENWFYRDDLRLARSLLDEGRIGRVHLVAWRCVTQLVPRATSRARGGGTGQSTKGDRTWTVGSTISPNCASSAATPIGCRARSRTPTASSTAHRTLPFPCGSWVAPPALMRRPTRSWQGRRSRTSCGSTGPRRP